MPPKRKQKKNQAQAENEAPATEVGEKTEERVETQENEVVSPKANLEGTGDNNQQPQEEAKLPETSDNVTATETQETQPNETENKVEEQQSTLEQTTTTTNNEEPVKTEPEAVDTNATTDNTATEPTHQEQQPEPEPDINQTSPVKEEVPVEETKPEVQVEETKPEVQVEETKPEEPVHVEPEVKKEESPVKEEPQQSPRKEEPRETDNSMTTSQWVTVQEKSAEKQENEPLQKSLGKSWAVVDGKSEGEGSAHSDRAIDNTYGTRIMEDSTPVKTGKISFDDLPQVTTQTRLQSAEESIQKAQALVKTANHQEAIKEFLNVIDTLNPEYFKDDKEGLQQANQKIVECTCEIAGSYHALNNHEQSGKYAKAALDFDAQNLRAIYYLGLSLVATGKTEEALTTFKQSKSVKNPKDLEYLGKIQKEIEKLEPTEAKETKKEEPAKKEEPKKTETPATEKKDEDMSGAAYFMGSLISSGLISFYVTKLLKFPTQKGVITSIGVGVAVGALSLLVNGISSKKNKK